MKVNGKVAFYFFGRAVEVPTGQDVTVNTIDDAIAGTLVGLNDEGILVRTPAGILTIVPEDVESLDWQGTRYKDRVERVEAPATREAR